jgi:hypothetical protein
MDDLCFDRYQIYLQLKKDFIHGRLHCSEEDTSQLAAYIIQCKFFTDLEVLFVLEN